jgi:hypothetical protein
MIDQLFKHGRIEFPLAHEIDQNAGINIAAAVPMITPPVGVNPMLVSIDLPPLTAVTLAPLPRWAITRRFGRSSANWWTIDSQERP